MITLPPTLITVDLQHGYRSAQLWSFVHGFITLELAETFVDCCGPARQVLLPMGVNLSVGLGDTRERAQASHEAAARLYDSITTDRQQPGGAVK